MPTLEKNNAAPPEQSTGKIAVSAAGQAALAAGATALFVHQVNPLAKKTGEILIASSPLADITGPSLGKAIVSEHSRVDNSQKPGVLGLGFEAVTLLVAVTALSGALGKIQKIGSRLFGASESPEANIKQTGAVILENFAILNASKFQTNNAAFMFAAKYIGTIGVAIPLINSAVCRFAPMAAFSQVASTFAFGLASAAAATVCATALSRLFNCNTALACSQAGLKPTFTAKALSYATPLALNLGFWALQSSQGWQAATIANLTLGVVSSAIIGGGLAFSSRMQVNQMLKSGISPQTGKRVTSIEPQADMAEPIVLSVGEASLLKGHLICSEIHFFDMKPGKALRFGVSTELEVVKQFFAKAVDRLTDNAPLTKRERGAIIQVLEAAVKLCDTRADEFESQLSQPASRKSLFAKIFAGSMHAGASKSRSTAETLRDLITNVQELPLAEELEA